MCLYIVFIIVFVLPTPYHIFPLRDNKSAELMNHFILGSPCLSIKWVIVSALNEMSILYRFLL